MLQLSHATLRDESLPHQVVIFCNTGTIHVSCNCRKTGAGYNDLQHYESMGVTESIEESRRLYNDPANHRVPFSEEDVAKW